MGSITLSPSAPAVMSTKSTRQEQAAAPLSARMQSSAAGRMKQ